MPLTLIQHYDLSWLALRLATDLRHRPSGLGALEAEPLIVQTPGMEKWVALECARLNGSYTRVQAQTPVQFLMKLGFLALKKTEDRSVFEKDVLPWALYRILQEDLKLGLDELDALRSYVHFGTPGQGEEASVRLFSLASSLGDLFDQYMLYRPEWLAVWEGHGQVAELAKFARDEEAWQGHLWRRLQALAQLTPSPVNRDQYFSRLFAALEHPDPKWPIPPRIFLFGMSVLPPRFLEIFQVLGEHTQVLVYLQTPTLHYWGDLQRDSVALKAGVAPTGNRLLANLGEAGQEFLDLLLATNPHQIDTWSDADFFPPEPTTLLGWLKQDVLLCREAANEPRVLTDDDSLRLARCTSPLREVEVLHDLLLDALADHPELTPSDLLIVSPDLETYAPLIEQAFTRVPFTVADHPALAENRPMRLAADLLQAAAGGFSPAEVVGLFEEACDVAGKPLDAREREVVTDWVLNSGIRHEFSGPELTWEAGLARLMAGYSIDGQEPAEGGLLPVAGVTSQAPLLGRLAEFVRTLAALAELKGRSMLLADWIGQIRRPLALLLGGEDEVDGGADFTPLGPLTLAADRLSERFVLTGLEAQSLSWDLVLRAWIDELAVAAAPGSFLSGRATVCGMVPMRSLPFPVIAVLGLQQGLYPRHSEAPEYDLMRLVRHGGDRDVLQSDRYLFLELLTAAGDRLILTASGLTDKGEASPLSSVAQLLVSWLDREYLVERKGGPKPAGEAITVTYPLSPASLRYQWQHGGVEVSTWNTRWFEVLPEAPPAVPFWDWRARAPERAAEVGAGWLVRALDDPLKAFFEQGLEALEPRAAEALPESELFGVHGLDEYQLRSAVYAVDRGDLWALARLRASGGLPPGNAGDHWQNAEVRNLASRLAAAERALGTKPTYQRVCLGGNGLHALVWEGELARHGSRQVLLDPGKVKGKRRLNAAIVHALANLAGPWTTVLVALDATLQFGPLPGDEARAYLDRWLGLGYQSVERPLPFTLNAAWAACEKPGADRESRLHDAWKQLEGPLGTKYNGSRWELNPRLIRAFDGALDLEEAGVAELFLTCAEQLFALWPGERL
ncbi:MAG: exodeoxyribonuclease V subunit gamma [Spirochaetales bacterium]